MTAKVLSVPKSEVAAKLAEITIEYQDKAIAKNGVFNVAISGGSLANTMATGMLNNPKIQWSKWVIWLADERIVPLDHEDSNWGIFNKEVIEKLPESDRPKSHTIATNLDYNKSSTEEYAADYQKQLVDALGDKPAIDFIFMGAGPDAHTCSLFPGHKLLDEHKLFVAGIDDSPKPPPRRITLTKPTLGLADKLVFVCTGAGKQPALEGIFVKKDAGLPSFQVNELAKNEVIWLCDSDATSTIKSVL